MTICQMRADWASPDSTGEQCAGQERAGGGGPSSLTACASQCMRPGRHMHAALAAGRRLVSEALASGPCHALIGPDHYGGAAPTSQRRGGEARQGRHHPGSGMAPCLPTRWPAPPAALQVLAGIACYDAKLARQAGQRASCFQAGSHELTCRRPPHSLLTALQPQPRSLQCGGGGPGQWPAGPARSEGRPRPRRPCILDRRQPAHVCLHVLLPPALTQLPTPAWFVAMRACKTDPLNRSMGHAGRSFPPGPLPTGIPVGFSLKSRAAGFVSGLFKVRASGWGQRSVGVRLAAAAACTAVDWQSTFRRCSMLVLAG